MSIQGLNNSREVRTQHTPSEVSNTQETRLYQSIRSEQQVSITTSPISTQTDPSDTGDIPPPMSEGGNGVARHDWLEERVDSLQAVVDLANERLDALNELARNGTTEQRAAAREVLRQIRVAERELARDRRELEWLEEMDNQGRFRYMVQRPAPQGDVVGSEPTFPTPSSTTETLNGGHGRSTGTGDVILNDVSGDVAFRRNGSSLFVGDYEIQNAFDESGKMVRRVYLRGGEVNQTFFHAMNETNIAPNRDGDGEIIGGVSFSARSANPTTAANPPFPSDSSWVADTTPNANGEIVYRNSRGTGTSTFTAPSNYRGQPVRAVEVIEDPQHPGDVLVRLRSTPRGNVLVTYRLVGAKNMMENISNNDSTVGRLKFQGGENGQYWDASTVRIDWTGGNGGHNMIRFREGRAQAGNAGDYIKQEGGGPATILGGSGNDFLVGGTAETGDLTIDGGDGNDFIFGGGHANRGSSNKNLQGSRGNDVIIVDSRDTRIRVDGGEGGFDYTNSTGADNTSNFEDNTLAEQQRALDQWMNENPRPVPANPLHPTPEERSSIAYYNTQLANMRNAIQRGSSAISSGAMRIFQSKESEFLSFFSGNSSSFTDTETDWQHPDFESNSNTGRSET